MIHGQVLGDQLVLAKLKNASVLVKSNVFRTIIGLSIQLQKHVKLNKLTGQVLHVRTGTLRRSINRKVDQTATSITATVGTNVKYAAAHEFGFSGAVTVKAHMRMMRQAWGKTLKNPRLISIGAHSKTINIPQRSFLRSALKDMENVIRSEMAQAAKTSAKELGL